MNSQKLRTRKLTYEAQRRQGGEVMVPCLHLAGVWLENLGFEIGDRVEIVEREGLLVIQPYRATSVDVQKQSQKLEAELKKVKQILRQVA